MNKEKIVGFIMMLVIESTRKALNILDEYNLEDDQLLRVQIQNIEYYARMIIEKDGAK